MVKRYTAHVTRLNGAVEETDLGYAQDAHLTFVEVDLHEPMTAINSLPSGIVAGKDIEVTGTVSDDAGFSSGIEKVELFVDGVLKGEVSFPSPNTWRSVVNFATEGTYNLQAKATDVAGNVGTSEMVTVTVGPAPIGEDTSRIIGGDYISQLLHDRTPTGLQSNMTEIRARMKQLKKDHINFIRVPYYWDALLAGPEEVMEEIENIAIAAGEVGIEVEYVFFHWRTARYFDQGGTGFPDFVVQGYPKTLGDERDARPFWRDLLNNRVVGGKALWDHIAGVILKVVARVDKYANVWGYEILNEPQFPDADEATHKKYGVMNTYIATKIRAKTQKFIILCEGNGLAGGAKVPKWEYHTFPRVSKVMYSPHRYNIAGFDKEIVQVKNLIAKWKSLGYDIRGMFWGEWAIGPTDYGGSPHTIESARTFMSGFKNAGHGWIYWAMFGFKQRIGRVVYEPRKPDGTYPHTETGKILFQVLKELYPNQV